MARLSKKDEELLRAVQKQAAREDTAQVLLGKAAQAARHTPLAQATLLPARLTEPVETVESSESAGPPVSTAAGAAPGDLKSSAPASPPVCSAASTHASSSSVGLGVDLLEIERMEQAIARTPRILERVFTSGERAYAWTKARPAVSYALFFAAREAVLKALGCGFAGVQYNDVEIAHNSKGKPEVLLHGNARTIAEQQGVVEIQISLSHTHQMAVASAVAIKAHSRPRKTEQVDPMAELSRQFKELRSMLDDLGVDTTGGEATSNDPSLATEVPSGQARRKGSDA